MSKQLRSGSTSRREFLARTGLAFAGTILNLKSIAEIQETKKDLIIDSHQHMRPNKRTEQQMLGHQRVRGVTTTILLPLERSVNSASTPGISGNEACYLFAKKYPKEFLFGASAVPGSRDAIREIEKYLKLGAVVIGEMKFGVECDSPEMQKVYQLAQTYNVPVIIHWQYKKYNYGFERFYKMLEKYPKTNFIGHAQTWWANIDKNYIDQSVLYPKGAITPGGITDRYLSDYPNIYGDLSSGSGLNALTRDQDHAKHFLEKYQNKLIYGSDCEDSSGLASLGCIGALDIVEVQKLVPTKEIERKLLYENAKGLFHL